MPEFDPYHVLGLPETASLEEIKRSYRRLARLYHPDGGAETGDKFLELSRAYEILCRQKRREQDRSGAEDHAFEAGSERSNPNARSGESTERENRRTDSRRGSDLEYDLTIDFLQALEGVTVSATVLDRTVDVHIPPGVDSGTIVRAAGQGAPGSRGGENGDLLLRITVKGHPLYRRERADIHFDVPISIREAVLGAAMTAGVGAGLYDSYAHAVSSAVPQTPSKVR
jgi:DnaJ-class molecular chaperone